MNQEVCRAIEVAFAKVTLGGGVGLQEAQGIDDYADAQTRAAYRASDERDDWRRIPADALNRCHSSLSFFDAEGMRFHLPAYLLADLRGDYRCGMLFCLTHLSDYSIGQFALLSPGQRAAVRAYLLHVMDERDGEFFRADVVRALAEFWTEAPSA